MTFGNQIAEIVHGVCNEFLGAPNKNNGDTFLIIWRVIETGDEASGNATRPNPAEMSVTAFATILGALHSSKQLAEYRGHPGLQMRLGSDARVNISFGLHAGWAIEGAVGSEYKIDASYLSPTVSIASSIERATETYDVSLIVSEAVVTLCGKQMQGKCRLIDNVMIRGSTNPIELYSVDLDYMALGVESDDEPSLKNWNPKMRLKARQFMEQEKKFIVNHDMIDVFDDDPLIRSMRRRYTVDFFQYFNMGYQNYSQGQWEDAKTWLSKSRDMLDVVDGPSRALIAFMEERSRSRSRLDAPKDWKGVRGLGLEIGKPKKSELSL
jgi:class 3 adenylate cyclase